MSRKSASYRREKLTLARLASYDDIITDVLIDRVYFWSKIQKNRTKYSHARGLSDEKVPSILRDNVIVAKDVDKAENSLLELPPLKKFVARLSGIKEREWFHRHLRKYINIYLPDCPFEVTTTNRYTITVYEAAVSARRFIHGGETIKGLTGTLVAMTREEEEHLDMTRRDFSIVMSSRRKMPSIFLGPARFANHDCNANCKLVMRSSETMEVVAIRDIDIDEEITVTYGDNYFGEDNCECLCRTCELCSRNGWTSQHPESSSEDDDQNGDENDADTPLQSTEVPSRKRKRGYSDASSQSFSVRERSQTSGAEPPKLSLREGSVIAAVDTDNPSSSIQIKEEYSFTASNDAKSKPHISVDGTAPLFNDSYAQSHPSVAFMIDMGFPIRGSTSSSTLTPNATALAMGSATETPQTRPLPDIYFCPQMPPTAPSSESLESSRTDATASMPTSRDSMASSVNVSQVASAPGSKSQDVQLHGGSSQQMIVTSGCSEQGNSPHVLQVTPVIRPGADQILFENASNYPESTRIVQPESDGYGTNKLPLTSSRPVELPDLTVSDHQRSVGDTNHSGPEPLQTTNEPKDLDAEVNEKPSRRRKRNGNFPVAEVTAPIPFRTPGDYTRTPKLIASRYDRWVECTTCRSWFVQSDSYNTRRECPRCERHSKLYGYRWPKTQKWGVRDTEERVTDHRTVHRFLCPEEEAEVSKRDRGCLSREENKAAFFSMSDRLGTSSMSPGRCSPMSAAKNKSFTRDGSEITMDTDDAISDEDNPPKRVTRASKKAARERRIVSTHLC
ncbi:Histone-lysine N-methyltransferase set9 [Ascosphaera aggregata]|nr:Histone-lysine N-methyltransferase set9 [Ascosphaera aggregata]